MAATFFERLKTELEHIHGVLEAELEDEMADFDPEDLRGREGWL